MKSKYWVYGIFTLAVIGIIFISGCGQKEYVCPNGITVSDPSLCSIQDIQLEQKNKQEDKKECYVATWGSFSTACYDYRGEEPYVSTAYCDGDVEVYEDYICKNNLCEKSIRRQDCSKDLTNVKGWTCMKSNNPSRDGWMVTCTPK